MNRAMPTSLFSAGALAVAFTLTAAADPGEARHNWPQWRGPLASGVGPEADPPLEWSETNNVKWKVAIPGAGSSTPIVWGNRVFVLTAVRAGKAAEAKLADEKIKQNGSTNPADPPPAREGGPPGEARPRGGLRGPGGPGGPGGPPGGFGGGEKPVDPYRFVILCLDRATGNILWQKIAREEVPHEGIQPNNTYASASPITDGQVVLAFFGSRGLHCYDLDGNLKWSKDFGHMQTRMGFGEGSSPALYGNTVIVNWDDETDNDFIVALDKRDGKELWRTPRNEPTGWSTPLVVEHGSKPQVVVNATGKVRSYDLATGKEIWSCAGQTPNAIPSPVADDETVYCTSGFRGAALYAIKLGANGDIGGTDAVRWMHNKGTPYVPSPLLVDDLIYVISGNNGILTCLNAKTGVANYELERLEQLREVYASPVAAKDRVYVLGRDGKCVVLRKGPKLEILATNKLDDKTDASIALAGKELFIRGKENLYSIEEK
jgi:outer membrane protein assembly factor BamB